MNWKFLINLLGVMFAGGAILYGVIDTYGWWVAGGMVLGSFVILFILEWIGHREIK